MCKIIILEPGYTLPYKMLENACFNNPHGYGLVLKDQKTKTLQVLKKCDPGKENDPKEIYDLLKDNEDIQRFLHMRWRTEGPIDKDNAHPFTAFFTDKRQVYFMHNGTLQDYKPKTYTYVNNTRVNTEEETSSDSKRFNDELLQPLLSRWIGPEGKGDISDPFLHSIIMKYWGYGDNKGILISNDQDYTLINKGAWKEIKDDDGKIFIASNNSYFEKVTRGPEFERRKKQEEEERKARFQSDSRSGWARNNNENNDWPISNLKDIDFKKRVALTEELDNIFNDFDLWTPEGLSQLENLTRDEIQSWCKKDHEGSAALIEYMTGEFATLYQKFSRATNYIRDMKTKGSSSEDISDIK